MCVSYQKLNDITKTFEFPIPHFGDAISSVGTGSGLSSASTPARVNIKFKCEEFMNKSSPSLPQIKNYCFCVMPFGPKKAPGFYSAMMLNFKEEWGSLFTQTLCSIYSLGNNVVSATDTDEIFLNQTKLVSGSRTIIDEILLFCSNLDIILIYLERVCNFFLEYLVSFKIDKCDFLKIDYNMSAMTSPKRVTGPLNQNSTLLTTG